MKLALLQCDVTENLDYNCGKIISFCQESEADLFITAAETLAGPCPCRIDSIQAEKTLARLANAVPVGKLLLCALPAASPSLVGDGKVSPVAGVFELGGLCFGVDLGPEDSPQVDVSVNLAARPYAPNIQADWEIVLSGAARLASSFSVSLNLVGGYGGQIYNGQSVAMNADGLLAGRAKAFAEDMLLLDTDECSANRIEPDLPDKLASQWAALKLGLADFIKKAGASKAVLGLSGGMDSALVACIAADALGPRNVAGVLMPSQWTSAESLTDARELAQNLGIETFEIPIAPVYESFQTGLESAFAKLAKLEGDLTNENLQARIRGVLLMALANRTGALVLTTGNKSELAMGYCTLYGDTAGAVAVIGDLFKTEVYSLARWYCENFGEKIPKNIFEKAPSAELRPNQKDTDSLPPYDELDPQLTEILRSAGSPELRRKVESFAFKRGQCPPPLLVSGLPLARLCAP